MHKYEKKTTVSPELINPFTLEPESFGEKAYLPQVTTTEYLENLKEELGNKQSPENQAYGERQEMFNHYDQLFEAISNLDPNVDVIDAIKNTIEELLRDRYPKKYIFAKHLSTYQENPDGGSTLLHHLDQVRDSAVAMFLETSPSSNGQVEYTSKFPTLFTDRQAKLLAFGVSPVHDLLKYLGTFGAQIAADHEILTHHLVQETFAGKRLTLPNDEQLTLTEDDAFFMAEIVGDHENLLKEKGREQQLSTQPSDESSEAHQKAAIERGKGAFFLIDTLTGVFEPSADNPNTFVYNEAKLKERFVDLYVRHFDRNRGAKIFRPEWGLETLKVYEQSLQKMEGLGAKFVSEAGGQQTELSVANMVQSWARSMAIEIAGIPLYDKKESSSFSEDDISRLITVIQELDTRYGEKIDKPKQWEQLIRGPFELALAVLQGKKIIFSGGSSNFIDGETGIKMDGKSRDDINDLLNELGLAFFDPEVSEETHGRNYIYEIDGPVEQLARLLSQLNGMQFFSVDKKSLSGVTILELIMDTMLSIQGGSGEINAAEIITLADAQFEPEFPEKMRLGYWSVLEAHLEEFAKAERNMRKSFVDFAKQIDNLTISYGQSNQGLEENNSSVKQYVFEKNEPISDTLVEILIEAKQNPNSAIEVVFKDVASKKDFSGVDVVGAMKKKHIMRAEIFKNYKEMGNRMRARLISHLQWVENDQKERGLSNLHVYNNAEAAAVELRKRLEKKT